MGLRKFTFFSVGYQIDYSVRKSGFTIGPAFEISWLLAVSWTPGPSKPLPIAPNAPTK